MKSFVTSALLTLALALVFVVGVAVFDRLLIDSDPAFLSNASGAFFGALFGFLSARLGDLIGRLGRREAEHHSALVKYEFYLNDTMNDVGDLLFVIDDFREKFKSRQAQVRLWSNHLRPVQIESNALLQLRNLDLLNEIMAFNVDIRKLNSSMETLNRAYDRAAQAFIDGKLDVESYWGNVEYLSTGMAEIRGFADVAMEDMQNLLSKVRVLAKERPIATRIFRGTRRLHYSARQQRLFESERTKLQLEIEATKAKSGQRIQKAQNRVGD